jgi:hypothetical protein
LCFSFERRSVLRFFGFPLNIWSALKFLKSSKEFITKRFRGGGPNYVTILVDFCSGFNITCIGGGGPNVLGEEDGFSFHWKLGVSLILMVFSLEIGSVLTVCEVSLPFVVFPLELVNVLGCMGCSNGNVECP